VACFSSAATRTNRNLDHASIAQKTWTPAITPQSMTRCSPGLHTAGRLPRPCSRRHAFFSCATRRRKFLSDPVYPWARAFGSSRFALIRPLVLFTDCATKSRTPSKFAGRGTRGGRSSPTSARSMTRLTVLCVVPQIAAAPR
jgi:hypothetical protein